MDRKMGLVRSMAGEMAREIGNRTREFYEFVLPPVDMRLEGGMLSVVIDMPGFDKKDIRLSLEGDVLSVQACKAPVDGAGMICNQRPNVIDKRLRLPVEPGEGGDRAGSARYEDGILTVVVPVQENGRDIKIE